MFSIPNIITSLNLFFGCCALVSINRADYSGCLYFIIGAVLADFLDGFTARKLNQTSALGLQLDSLSDVVSFGLVPAYIAFHFLEVYFPDFSWLAYCAFLLAIMAAFRLARYNLSGKGEAYFFEGLPVPANALFFVGLLGLEIDGRFLSTVECSGWLIIVLILLFSYLMVSRLKILKIHLDTAWLKSYSTLLILLFGGICTWFWIGPLALSFCVILHLMYSLIIHVFNPK